MNKCEEFIVNISTGHDSGHDISHIRRVIYNTRTINEKEKIADGDLAEMCALFHDVADHKFINDPAEQINRVRKFLNAEGVSEEWIDKVIYVAENISFSKGNNRGKPTPELEIVMDADRLDAMGAIGIARAFSYGGFRNRPMYGDDLRGNTIGHFSEKLQIGRAHV